MAKIDKKVIAALREDGKRLEAKRKKLKELENIYQKTMGFENQPTRGGNPFADLTAPKPTKLSKSGFVNQRHQIKNLMRKLKGQKQKKYADQAYKSLLKGT